MAGKQRSHRKEGDHWRQQRQHHLIGAAIDGLKITAPSTSISRVSEARSTV
jgi:hypothetical protein